VPYCQLLGIQSGKLFWNQNQKKIFIGRKIGYNVFADIVNEAGLLTDCESFDVILELSCYGLCQVVRRVTYSLNMDDIVHLMTSPPTSFHEVTGFDAQG